VHALNHQRAKKRKKFEESKRNKEERRNFAQNPSPLRERKKNNDESRPTLKQERSMILSRFKSSGEDEHEGNERTTRRAHLEEPSSSTYSYVFFFGTKNVFSKV
jgi:hypothetical protein